MSKPKDIEIKDNTSDNNNNIEFTEVKEGQLIDLGEAYDELDQNKIDLLVDGMEQYRTTGKLNSKLEKFIKVNGNQSFEPGSSIFNGRIGSEGLFSTIKEGFISFIKAIIEFIKRIYNWIKERIKTLFGFNKSKRQLEEVAKIRDDLKAELLELLTALKLPPDTYNIEYILNKVPEGSTRLETLSFLKNKFDDDGKHLSRLANALPAISELFDTAKSVSREMTVASQSVSRAISDVKRKLSKNTASGGDAINLLRLVTDARTRINHGKMNACLNSLTKIMFDVEINEADISLSYDKARKAIAERTEYHKKIKLSPSQINALNLQVTAFEAAVRANVTTPLALSEGWEEPINLDDAKVIQAVSEFLGSQDLINQYVAYSNESKDFSNNLNLTLKIANEVFKSIEDLLLWKDRVDATIMVYLTEDIEAIRAWFLKVKAEGNIDTKVIDREGSPRVYVVTENLATETFFEDIQDLANKGFNDEALGLKKKVNNFAAQCGINKRV